MKLSFIQSNWLRKYPFRAGHGENVPTDVLVSLRLTVKAGDLDVYVDKIYINNYNISISFSGANGPIGYANAKITESNQSIPILSYLAGAIGNVTIGNIDSLVSSQLFTFTNTTGLIEPGTLLILPEPVVTSLNVKGTKLTGAITINSNTLNINSGSAINISVVNPASIQSREDKCSQFITCDNKVVSGINNTVPDKNNNIDIYALSPLTITAAVVDGVTQLQFDTPGLNLDNLCKIVNIPPDNSSNTYEDISTVTTPEWKGWPQYE